MMPLFKIDLEISQLKLSAAITVEDELMQSVASVAAQKIAEAFAKYDDGGVADNKPAA